MQISTQIDIEAIVKTKLPPLPGTMMKISSLLRDMSVSPKAIAEAIGCDPMIAARILRLANSPVYARQRSITSLTEAVMAIGNMAIYQMVLVGVISDAFAEEMRTSVIGRDNLEHSLAVALVAREICVLKRLPDADEIFTCGLLHDIGKILLLRANPALYTEVHNITPVNDLPNIEKAIFGYSHAEVGEAMARKWGLPESVSRIILDHHTPELSPNNSAVTHAVFVADNLSYLKNQGWQIEDEGRLLETDSVLMLNLTAEQLENIWEKVAPELKELIRTLT